MVIMKSGKRFGDERLITLDLNKSLIKNLTQDNEAAAQHHIQKSTSKINQYNP